MDSLRSSNGRNYDTNGRSRCRDLVPYLRSSDNIFDDLPLVVGTCAIRDRIDITNVQHALVTNIYNDKRKVSKTCISGRRINDRTILDEKPQRRLQLTTKQVAFEIQHRRTSLSGMIRASFETSHPQIMWVSLFSYSFSFFFNPFLFFFILFYSFLIRFYFLFSFLFIPVYSFHPLLFFYSFLKFFFFTLFLFYSSPFES